MKELTIVKLFLFLTTGNQHWSCPVVWPSKGWSIRPVVFKGANPTFIDGLLSSSLILRQAQPRPMSTTYGPLPENEFHDEWNTFTHPRPISILLSDDDGSGIPMVSTYPDNITDNDMALSMLNTLPDNPTDGIDNDMDMPSATRGNDMSTPYPTHGNDMTMLSSSRSFPAFTYNTEEDHEKLEDLSSELHKLVTDMSTKRCRRKRFRHAGSASTDVSSAVPREQTDADVVKFIANKCNTDASEFIHTLITQYNTRCLRDKCCITSNCHGQLFLESSACPTQLLAKGLLTHGHKLGIVVAAGKQIAVNSTVSEYTGKRVDAKVVRTWQKNDPRRTYMICSVDDDASTEKKAGAFYIVPKLRRSKTKPELSNHAAHVRSAVHSRGKGANCRLVHRGGRVWLCSLDNPIVSGEELFIDI